MPITPQQAAVAEEAQWKAAKEAAQQVNLGLPFDPPAGEALRDEVAFRAVYTILRLVSDLTTNSRDIAYRGLLG